MLTIQLAATELFDNERQTFIPLPAATLQLEHSLLSISKWEQKWKKSFLDKNAVRTVAESRDYVRCMTINHADPTAYMRLGEADMDKIQKYINDPASATVIKRQAGKGSSEILTSELIYYRMVEAGIPFECQKWHLNRLITLINIYGEKQKTPQKMSRSEVYAQNRALNAARKAKTGSKG